MLRRVASAFTVMVGGVFLFLSGLSLDGDFEIDPLMLGLGGLIVTLGLLSFWVGVRAGRWIQYAAVFAYGSTLFVSLSHAATPQDANGRIAMGGLCLMAFLFGSYLRRPRFAGRNTLSDHSH